MIKGDEFLFFKLTLVGDVQLPNEYICPMFVDEQSTARLYMKLIGKVVNHEADSLTSQNFPVEIALEDLNLVLLQLNELALFWDNFCFAMNSRFYSSRPFGMFMTMIF